MTASTSDWFAYAILAVVVGLVLKRLLTVLIARQKLPAILKEGAQIIDVRSPGEFAAGHASGSRNIPLDSLDAAISSLNPTRWVVLCCASGTRSAMAERRLRRKGFTQVINAGSWRQLP